MKTKHILDIYRVFSLNICNIFGDGWNHLANKHNTIPFPHLIKSEHKCADRSKL